MTKQDVENVLNLVSNLNSKRIQHWSINCFHTQCLRICFLSISILAELFTGPTGAIFFLEFVNVVWSHFHKTAVGYYIFITVALKRATSLKLTWKQNWPYLLCYCTSLILLWITNQCTFFFQKVVVIIIIQNAIIFSYSETTFLLW